VCGNQDEERELSMKGFLAVCLIVSVLAGAAFGDEKMVPNPRVTLETSKGNIVLELFPGKAPISVKNFLDYTTSGFYQGTIFHRVIPGFMIQGGGFTRDMALKETSKPIRNEADNSLKNDRGTIAMARTRDPHSASSQFFINTVDNHFLNFKSQTLPGWGYAVFGKVVQGMDVVDGIADAKTTMRNGYRDVPEVPIEILRALNTPESGSASN
jgi:peptidyl-prolyl cis-trans isomerase B (cyclophilin B)